MTDRQQVRFRHRRDRRSISLDAADPQIGAYEAHPNWVRDGAAPEAEPDETPVIE